MKATLSFNLPEEEDDFELASNANKLLCVLHELDQELRAEVKYHDDLTEERRKAFEYVRDRIFEIAKAYNISHLLL
jgi:hypothetical protein